MGRVISEAQCVIKCAEAIRCHPNTTKQGQLNSWLTKLYLENVDFRTELTSRNGNNLADYCCKMVEDYSAVSKVQP